MKTKKTRLDFNSIKTISVLYFLLFAAALLVIIWWLQTFFLNNYYENMKAQETRRTAMLLEHQYLKSRDGFDDLAGQTSLDNGVFIRVDDSYGICEYESGMSTQTSSGSYADEIKTAEDALRNSELNSVSIKLRDKTTDMSKLVYAAYLRGRSDSAVIYVISPLYPLQSTVTILREQLIYISVIALFIAIALALFFSHRLTTPIESITDSAVDLSCGKYNVKFNGGIFTETNELAKALNTASYELQKTDSYQKDLIANVSHDLKTPLTMIRSYAEMISDISGDNPEKREEHLHVIISETDRLNKLVSDMLAMSRLQSNTAELNKAKFDFTETAKSAVEPFEILNEQAGYNIQVSICKPAYVFGDEGRLRQVMTNLISNAVKYCGKDKFIKIDVKRSGKKIRFDVIDHGEGIPSEELSHVWDRYYRTSANHERQIEGTGLGLAIVKGILSLHNADYGVKSKEGEGSDFWFEMDIVKK